jgi:hypothetical protein
MVVVLKECFLENSNTFVEFLQRKKSVSFSGKSFGELDVIIRVSIGGLDSVIAAIDAVFKFLHLEVDSSFV